MDLLTGLEYLQCEIACKHNKACEKLTWKERLDYFTTLNLSDPNIYKKAYNPIGLRAAIEAYKDTQNNIPSGYLISLDATSSGLQLLSLLISCPISWNLCGGNHKECVDSYTTLYEAMNLGDKLSRSEVKQAIMTALYGSESIPDKVFGDYVDIFYKVLEKMLPGAWELNMSLQELWHRIRGSTYSWIMPDNFHCHIETVSPVFVPFTFLGREFNIKQYQNKRPKFHKGLGPNLIHSVDSYIVREMTRRCMYDKKKITRIINSLDTNGTFGKHEKIVSTLWTHYKKTGILSTRILDFLGPETMGLVDPIVIAKMIKTYPEEPFHLLTIHDNFRSHPNYGNDVRKQYNLILAEINQSTLLQFMVRQITNSPKLIVNKTGLINKVNVENSNYALC